MKSRRVIPHAFDIQQLQGWICLSDIVFASELELIWYKTA